MRKFLIFVGLVVALVLAGCGSTQTVSHPGNFAGGRTHALGFGQPPVGDFGLPSHGLKATFTIQGYDAVYVPAIPTWAASAGCYNSGYPNCTAVRARATIANANGRIVTIATRASVVARCLDVEPGDAYPSQAPGWVKWMIHLQLARPCVYADASHMSGTYGVRAYMARSGLSRSQYSLWIADWDGNPTIPAGYDAKQWHSILTIYGYDNDTFGSWFFGPPPVPNAPGCTDPSTSKSYCYGRFPSVKFYNSTKNGWCSKGCNERGVVESYDYHRTHSGYATAITLDRARLAFLDHRLLYLIHNRSVAINGKYYVYGREHNEYNRAYRGTYTLKSSWAGYDF